MTWATLPDSVPENAEEGAEEEQALKPPPALAGWPIGFADRIKHSAAVGHYGAATQCDSRA